MECSEYSRADKRIEICENDVTSSSRVCVSESLP